MIENETYPLDEPITKIIRYEFLTFTISELMVQAFKSATMRVELNTIDQGVGEILFLTMEGPAYDLWNSDEYLVNWVREQLKIIYQK
jgi:hypothetical protein